LYILSSAEHTQDADWRNEGVETTRGQVARFYNLAREIISDGEIDPEAEKTLIDRWMLSRLQRRIVETTDALEEIQTRRALQSAFFHMINDLRWYQRRGGKNQLRKVLDVWVRLMSPFTPHVCEEIWEEMAGGYASLAEWPRPDSHLVDEGAEIAEDLLERTLSDVEEILRVTNQTPRKVILYTSPKWKNTMLQMALDLKEKNDLNVGSLMKPAMADPEIRARKKEAPKYAQRLMKDAHSLSSEPLLLDELETLGREKVYLEGALGCAVEVYSADQPDEDPMGKSRNAEPGRPAIFIE
jgi:leucyl-tRNA synthetase